MPQNNSKFPSKLLWPTLALLSAVPLALASQTSSNLASSMELSSFRGSLRSILLPIEDIKLSAGAAGIISRYMVDEGKRVSAGDIILELNTQEDVVAIMQAEALLDGTEAELEKTRKDFARAEKLYAENIQSERQFEEAKYLHAKAQSLHKQAQAGLQAAKISLEKKRVRSPIDGLFLKKYKSVGEAVDRFETVARVLDDSRLELTIYCGSHLFGAVQSDTSLPIEILDGPSRGTQALAQVMFIDPIIDPASGTFRIKLEIAPSEVVAPGLAVRLLLETPAPHQ